MHGHGKISQKLQGCDRSGGGSARTATTPHASHGGLCIQKKGSLIRGPCTRKPRGPLFGTYPMGRRSAPLGAKGPPKRSKSLVKSKTATSLGKRLEVHTENMARPHQLLGYYWCREPWRCVVGLRHCAEHPRARTVKKLQSGTERQGANGTGRQSHASRMA